jgi:hypothetical protein
MERPFTRKSVQVAKEPEHLLVSAQPNLCYGCHATAKADFAKPYHHRVEEGLIQCSECHNVHGTATLRQVRALPSGDAIAPSATPKSRAIRLRTCTGEDRGL